MYSPATYALAICSAITGMVGGALVLPDHTAPPVRIENIETVGDKVKYTRVNTVGRDVRAPFGGHVFDWATDQPVKGCEWAGFATYGAVEPQVQFFTVSQFYGPDCVGALEVGREYGHYGFVQPKDGPASSYTSQEPFVWAGVEQ